MSLSTKLRPHVQDLKVRKPPKEQSRTEQRLNFMTAIILNKTMTKQEKDRQLKALVADSQIEKRLKQMGIEV